MNKEKKTKSVDTQREARAVLRRVRVSPFKINLVAQTIRGLRVHDAINELTFSNKAIALDVKKTLMSAVANAQNNHGMEVDRLYVKGAHVGKSIVMKRFHARAKGRGAKILKPFSHLFITVAEKGDN